MKLRGLYHNSKVNELFIQLTKQRLIQAIVSCKMFNTMLISSSKFTYSIEIVTCANIISLIPHLSLLQGIFKASLG